MQLTNKAQYNKATYLRPYVSKFIRVLGTDNVGTTKKPHMNVLYAILANNGIQPIDKDAHGNFLFSYKDLDNLNDTSIIAGFRKWKEDMIRQDVEASEKKLNRINKNYTVSDRRDLINQHKQDMENASDELLRQQEVYFNESKDDELYRNLFGKKVYLTEQQVQYINESKKKNVKNDKGEVVPEICPECGSKVGLYIQGEPVYLCSNKKCNKYFGTMPFPKSLDDELDKEIEKKEKKLKENKATKKVYLTEAQIQYIKEHIENQVKEDEYIENEYNEKWLRLPTDSEIFKKIKKVIGFSNKSNLGLADVAKVIGGDEWEWEEGDKPYYIAIIRGGLNGSGKWTNYLKDIAKIIKEIPSSYLIDLDIDVCDDVWTLQLGFHQGQLNEGAWGYKPEESDSYLDLSHELGEPIIKILSKKLPKYVNNPKDNDGNIYYWLGLMLDMLKVKAFDESWLYINSEDGKDGKYKMIRNLFAVANKGFDYLLTDNAKDNRLGWDKFDEYQKYLKKMYGEFKKLEDYYNMDKDDPQGTDELIKESYVQPEKVLLIKRYLDNNFVKASMPIIGDDGYPTTQLLVGMKGTDGEIAKNMTAKQLFYLLQDKFKGIYADKLQRDNFLKQVMKDWYNDKITQQGLLSTNEY